MSGEVGVVLLVVALILLTGGLVLWLIMKPETKDSEEPEDDDLDDFP
jgi:hypothetical protein